MVTRADIAGALKLIHANNLSNRRGHIHNMVSAEHPPEHVAKVMSDLDSYEGWADRPELDAYERPAPKPRVPEKRK